MSRGVQTTPQGLIRITSCGTPVGAQSTLWDGRPSHAHHQLRYTCGSSVHTLGWTSLRWTSDVDLALPERDRRGELKKRTQPKPSNMQRVERYRHSWPLEPHGNARRVMHRRHAGAAPHLRRTIDRVMQHNP